MLVRSRRRSKRRQEVAEVGEHGAEHGALAGIVDEAVGGAALLAPVVAGVAVDQIDRRRQEIAKAMRGHRHAGLGVDQERGPARRTASATDRGSAAAAAAIGVRR